MAPSSKAASSKAACAGMAPQNGNFVEHYFASQNGNNVELYFAPQNGNFVETGNQVLHLQN